MVLVGLYILIDTDFREKIEMSCDPSNPIAGGSCPIINTGPPNVVLPLSGAISTPKQLRSSPEGSFDAIGRNIGAIGYYIDTLGAGPQYQGYGLRQVYNTGVACSNIKGQAHRLADGTAAGIGGYGLVPRMLGAVGGMMPGDLVSSSTDSTPCRMMMVHSNTPQEVGRLRGASGNLQQVVPRSNKIPVSTNSGKVDYVRMDQLCRQGQLTPCQSVPIRIGDVNMREGFESEIYSNTPQYDIQRPLLIAGGVLILGAVAMLATGSGGCK